MGNDARQRAWSYAATGNSRLLLLALAEHIQDGKHTCWPAIETIAGMVGIGVRQTQRLVQTLEAAGAIVTKTGRGRGHTTLYGLLVGLPNEQQDQIRCQVKGDISSLKPDTAMSPIDDQKGDISSRKGDIKPDIAMSPLDQEKVTFEAIKGDIAMSPRTMNRNDSRDLPNGRKASDPNFQPMFEAIATVCQIDLKLCTNTQRQQVAQTAKALRKAGKLPEEIPKVETWWYAKDWRGKKGDPPRPAQLQEIWKQATEQTNGVSRSANGRHPDPRAEWAGFTETDLDKPL